MPNEERTRGTVYCVIIGLAACILGAMLLRAASSSTPDNQELLTGLGGFLVVIGAPLFFIAALVELFSIGTHVRRTEAFLSQLLQRQSSPESTAPATAKVGPGGA